MFLLCHNRRMRVLKYYGEYSAYSIKSCYHDGKTGGCRNQDYYSSSPEIHSLVSDSEKGLERGENAGWEFKSKSARRIFLKIIFVTTIGSGVSLTGEVKI